MTMQFDYCKNTKS